MKHINSKDWVVAAFLAITITAVGIGYRYHVRGYIPNQVDTVVVRQDPKDTEIFNLKQRLKSCEGKVFTITNMRFDEYVIVKDLSGKKWRMAVSKQGYIYTTSIE